MIEIVQSCLAEAESVVDVIFRAPIHKDKAEAFLSKEHPDKPGRLEVVSFESSWPRRCLFVSDNAVRKNFGLAS